MGRVAVGGQRAGAGPLVGAGSLSERSTHQKPDVSPRWPRPPDRDGPEDGVDEVVEPGGYSTAPTASAGAGATASGSGSGALALTMMTGVPIATSPEMAWVMAPNFLPFVTSTGVARE